MWGCQVVKELLAANANPNYTVHLDGTSALHSAARNGNAQITSLLLEAHAKADVLDNNGMTSLELASLHSSRAHHDTVLLLQHLT